MAPHEQYRMVTMQRDPEQQPILTSAQAPGETYIASPSTEANTLENSQSQQSTHHHEIIPVHRRIHNHRDYVRRSAQGTNRTETYLSPYNRQLRNLVGQSSSEVRNSGSKARWFRIGFRNGSPWIIRLSNWAVSRDYDSEDEIKTHFPTAYLWFPACEALALTVSKTCRSCLRSLLTLLS